LFNNKIQSSATDAFQKQLSHFKNLKVIFLFQKAPFENAQIDDKNELGEFVELAKIPSSSKIF